MRTGPKALVGLGLPAALRPHAPNKGVGVPSGFSLWTTNGQAWRFGAQAQRAISPART